jgi:hypothetical protein
MPITASLNPCSKGVHVDHTLVFLQSSTNRNFPAGRLFAARSAWRHAILGTATPHQLSPERTATCAYVATHELDQRTWVWHHGRLQRRRRECILKADNGGWTLAREAGATVFTTLWRSRRHCLYDTIACRRQSLHDAVEKQVPLSSSVR